VYRDHEPGVARARGEKTSRSDRRVSPCPFSLPSPSRAPRRYYRLLTTGLIQRRCWNDESTLRYATGDERCPPVRRRRRAGAAASPPSRAELDHKGSAGLCPVADGVVSPGAGPRTSASVCDSTWAVRVAGMGGVMWRGHHWSVAIAVQVRCGRCSLLHAARLAGRLWVFVTDRGYVTNRMYVSCLSCAALYICPPSPSCMWYPSDLSRRRSIHTCAPCHRIDTSNCMVLVPLKKKHSGTGITYFCVHRFGGALPMHARLSTVVVDSLLNFRRSISEACAASKEHCCC
jgi:hypothetical protein